MTTKSPKPTKPYLLFVEDEQTVRDLLAERLSDEYEVETASDGEVALRSVLKRKPDLIVTDLVMPTLDGVELVNTLRSTPSTATIPILMISGRAGDELRMQGFEKGADAFLAKPYNEKELRTRIRTLLQTTSLRAEAVRVEARVRMEKELLEERAALLESISDAFFAIDRQWRFTYANQLALDYFGRTRDELIGREMWSVVPAGKGSQFEREYTRAMENRIPVHFETLSPHSKRWIDARVYPTPQGIAVTFRDITARKESEKALRDLTETLEERVAAVSAERDQAWNNTQDLLAVVSKDGVFLAANPAWTAVLGLSNDQVVGSTYLDLIHPEDHESARAAFATAALAPLRNFECRIRTHQGGYRCVSWVAAPAGERIYASGRDISLEKEALDALKQANARTRTIFETSYQYQGYLDPDGTLRDANLTSLAGIDCELEDVVGKYYWETPWFSSTPQIAEQIQADLQRVREGESIQREVTLNLPIGERIFDISIRPVFDERGNVLAMVPEAVDVTERKSNALQLAHMQKLETIGQLTGNVAHDFNNLLTPIVGTLELLHRKHTSHDDRARRLAIAALQSAERARALVQKLLAFARKQHLEARAVNIRNLLENLDDLIRRSIGPRIELIMDIEPDLPDTRVDANQLELALLNLALNARDAMPEGGTLKIEAKAERDRSRNESERFIHLYVSDTGCGMDATTLARAVEPFYTTKATGEGTGLGLSMVHGLAAQSGGELVLRSRVGQGTTAILKLPVSEERESLQSEDQVAIVAASSPITVLVVDDEDVVRSTITTMLEDGGYRVIQAASGTEALSKFEQESTIGALVTDFAMPGMTGVQLAASVRKVRSDIPILMVTGFANLIEGECGDLPRLAKPFTQPELVAKLVDICSSA